MKPKPKMTKAQHRTLMRHVGQTEGMILAYQFAEMVARRIVDIGPNLTPDILAQVGVPLGIMPMLVEDERGKKVRVRLKDYRGGKP